MGHRGGTGLRNLVQRPLAFFFESTTRIEAKEDPGSNSQAKVEPASMPSAAQTPAGIVALTDVDSFTARETLDLKTRAMEVLFQDCPLWLKDFALGIDQCKGQSFMVRPSLVIGQSIGQSTRPMPRDPRIMPKSSREPWALTLDERQRCLERRHARLSHRVRIHAAGLTRVVLVRDTTMAESDDHMVRGVELGKVPTKGGLLVHTVHTKAGPKVVRENVVTGAMTISGRPRPGPLGMLWKPSPVVLSVLRAKEPPMVELVKRPPVPADPTQIKAPRGKPDHVPESRPGRPVDQRSAAARLHHLAGLRLMSDQLGS